MMAGGMGMPGWRWRRARGLVAAAVLAAVMPFAASANPAQDVAARGCAAIADRVTRHAGGGPLFLRSWETAEGAPLDEPALRDAAFTYDNALAAIALLACGRPAEARRVGDALRLAVTRDRHWTDGRPRNAYRAGPVPAGTAPLPPGWWNGGANRWEEDAYLVGTATGNVAWAALALLALHDATGEASYLDAAKRALGWVLDATRAGDPAVFQGGYHGHEPVPVRLTWAATEHATDLVPAFARLHRLTGDARWSTAAGQARAFLDRMWDAAEGRFLIGLLPDGAPNRAGSGLDAQLWPLLAVPDHPPEGPADWRRALDFIDRAHGVDGGYDFDADRDGLWVEGTAQAALTFRAVGRPERAAALLAAVATEWSPGGLLFATRADSITTGLAIGPDSATADFLYHRRPHLGATAWAVLAALGWNPFTGARVP